MNNKICEIIAKKNGESMSKVKKEIEKAIQYAYKNPNSYAKKVPSKNNIPDIDEFISYVISRLYL